jgi:hypothetical protein
MFVTICPSAAPPQSLRHYVFVRWMDRADCFAYWVERI